MSHVQRVIGSGEIATLIIRRPPTQGPAQGADRYTLIATTRTDERRLSFRAEQRESWPRDRTAVENLVDEWLRTL